jgi:hypothetical protein
MTQKTIRYLVYSADDDFLGEWSDVTSPVSFKRQINNAMSSMQVSFARNELTSRLTTDTLQAEDLSVLTDESDDPLLIDLVAGVGIGPGTDLDLNYNVEIRTHYGSYVDLETEDSLVLQTESDESLEVQSGLPDGLTIFSGWIVDWDFEIGGQDTIGVSLLTHSTELSHIILESTAGGDTRVAFNSVDPSNIAKAVIDWAQTQGARINYTSSSIAMTGTTVSYEFNLNTIEECLNKVLELCPADWYWTYDPGTNLYSLQPRPSTPNRWFTKNSDYVSGKFKRSIARIVNRAFFTGGGTPALLIDRENVPSRTAWRRGLKKLSDSRVTVQSTAEIMADAEIDRFKDPEWVGDAIINGDHYDPIEQIALGELAGFVNFGTYIDTNAELQIVGINYNVDTVALDFERLLPPVAKRIEDLKRNLDEQAQENNPDAPL